ncbi:MAG: M36 family metallopeptidase [Chitinophagales bacterium]|nr:M36 family metallopeptidase [Chitinophagales bacterium]
MKKFLIWLIFFLPFSLLGQDKTPFEQAKAHIQTMAPSWQLIASDYEGIVLSSEATSMQGITYLYLNQAYQDIPIRNAMAVIVIKDGKVVSDQNNFVQNVESRVNAKAFKKGADEAIIQAAQHLGIALRSRPVMQGRTNDGKLVFDIPELTQEPIIAELKYEMVEDRLILVWNLSMDMKSGSDYWDMNIDAVTGDFVSKFNYTIYCHHPEHAFTNHDNCEAGHRHNIEQGSVLAPTASPTSIAQYNVFALPTESPIHGPRKLVGDEQYIAASPYGWHDTNGVEGAEFTITRGNNVYAYQDKNDDNRSDGPETEGGANLNFDFPIDLSKDPRENADAAVTNLFYMNNMIHDISFKLGFTEEFGNFQQKNYTGLGDDGDYVDAQAFDGITLHEAGQTDPAKINNANFSTPIDGFRPRMQMYLWTNTGGIVSIDEPENIKGFINEYGTAGFGFPIPNKDEAPIVGKMVVAKSAGPSGNTGCRAISNAAEVAGNIAIIDRGTCDFSQKVYNAQQAGAIAAIICNIPGIDGGNGEEIVGMAAGQNAENVTIPSIFVKKSVCDKIKVELSKGIDVVITFQERGNSGPKYFDGALDNGIIAHEYGHGISTRLTGGRLNSSCLNNDEQMGEGWSDFFALILTHQPGDKGTDARGIGNYAAGSSVEGGGIRRYPYSTDMNINPQTYKDIRGTTAPHPVGEVWTDILWDVYWRFVDQYGFDPDWNNETSGNFLAGTLVVEALKIQPCNPNFIKGRDAILKADSLLFGGKHGLLLWESFARRGVGYYASAGNTRNDNVEDFSLLPTLIEKLKISKTATSSIDAGDEVNIHIHAINHIPARQNEVIITDELPDGMTYVEGSANVTPKINGNLLIFDLGDLEYKDEIDITYKTKSSTDNKSIQLEIEDFEGNFDWDTENAEGSEEWITSFDIFRSPEISYSIFNGTSKGDASLITIPYEIRGVRPVMRFWHRYNTQSGNDGGFVEISNDNGSTYTRIPREKFIRNPYNSALAYGTLAETGVYAFTGNSGGNWTTTLEGNWVDSYIDLSEYSGQSVSFRFRFVSDDEGVGTGIFTGWYIDDFEIIDLFNYKSQACIVAENGAGEMACTDAIETIVNPDEISSTKDGLVREVLFSLQPNPAQDYVTLQLVSPVRQKVDVTISNLSGQVLYNTQIQVSETYHQATINTSGLPAGMYLVSMTGNNVVYTEKLIIK